MDQLFDPNEELPTRDSWDNHETNGPLDTRGSWINSHLGQFACPAIRFEGCDASVIDAVHPLIKKYLPHHAALLDELPSSSGRAPLCLHTVCSLRLTGTLTSAAHLIVAGGLQTGQCVGEAGRAGTSAAAHPVWLTASGWALTQCNSQPR